MKGIVKARNVKRDLKWEIGKGRLIVNPTIGRALIENYLLKFLLKKDYELEAGNEYKFIISAKF